MEIVMYINAALMIPTMIIAITKNSRVFCAVFGVQCLIYVIGGFCLLATK